jgi:hypothetical protein
VPLHMHYFRPVTKIPVVSTGFGMCENPCHGLHDSSDKLDAYSTGDFRAHRANAEFFSNVFYSK